MTSISGIKGTDVQAEMWFFLWIRLLLWRVLLQTFVFGDQGKHWKWNDLYLISGVGLTETWIDPRSGHCTSQVQIDKDFDQP